MSTFDRWLFSGLALIGVGNYKSILEEVDKRLGEQLANLYTNGGKALSVPAVSLLCPLDHLLFLKVQGERKACIKQRTVSALSNYDSLTAHLADRHRES